MKLKKQYTVKGIVAYENKYLLLRKENFTGGDYDTPGGRKFFDYEPDEVTLKREIKEETGLDIEIAKFLCEWDLNLKDQGIHLIGKTYLCLTPLDLVTLSSEHYSFVWVKYDHIKKFNLPKWLKISFKKIYH